VCIRGVCYPIIGLSSAFGGDWEQYWVFFLYDSIVRHVVLSIYHYILVNAISTRHQINVLSLFRCGNASISLMVV